ncbi:sigma 54-interacting transcriptional regulator [Desulfococcaceae bacterium HSG7]|nr:sigma 54-interacting transcriptional regulator [Desulfococcaceae bacterium HSG7]
MRWDTATRYRILLEINNAAVTHTSPEGLFKVLADELIKHFSYDRLSINLYDVDSQSLSYFTAAHGINPKGISCKNSRPLAKGAISRMAIQSRQPVIIDDLSRYSDRSSIGSMVKAGLNATMAFPLIIRNRVSGSIHFSFKKTPNHISELTEVLTDVSKQAAIAVDNMLAYMHLKKVNVDLEREKRYLMASTDEYKQEDFFVASPAMNEVMNLVERSADSDAAILITGETGTGKDYLARRIHNLSFRREHLFVKVNCPALASSLFESELFGHAKGAFTGAEFKRIGRFELANGGTIFLDEVGELPISLQAKLLHVLQDKQFERVGDSQSVKIDFRVIAASNKNLEESIRDGHFREDLFYRLHIVNIHVPPLRRRQEDIPLLMEKLTQLQALKTNRQEPLYTDGALAKLGAYKWPGNIRELKNLVKRMVILRPGEKITGEDIDMILGSSTPEHQTRHIDIAPLAEAERQHIIQALIKTRGVVGGEKGAARLLELPRSTLQYRLKKFGVNPGDYVKG